MTNVTIKKFQVPASTGNNAQTGVGFQPDAAMYIYSSYTTTPPSSQTNASSRMGYSFVKSTSKRGALAWGDDDSGGVLAKRAQKAESLLSITGSGVVRFESDHVSFDSDGFTNNFTTISASAFVWGIMFKGGQYDVEAVNQKTTTGTNSHTGVGFQPIGIINGSKGNTSSSSIENDSKNSFGAADGTNNSSVWKGSTNAAATTDTSSDTDNTQVIRMMTQGVSPSTEASATLNSFDADGWTYNWGTADATARQIYAMLFGSTGGAVANAIGYKNLLGVGM